MRKIWLPVFLLCLYASPAFGCDEGIFSREEVDRFFGRIAIAFAVANVLLGLDSFVRFGYEDRISLSIAPDTMARAIAHLIAGALLIVAALIVPEYGFVAVMVSVPFHLYMAYMGDQKRGTKGSA